MPELRPCPCCGGKGVKDEIPAHTHKLAAFMPDCTGRAVIECDTCQRVVIANTLEEALSEWNRRPPARRLTLDDLWGMDGKPVWVETGEIFIQEQIVGRWEILHGVSDLRVFFTGGGNGLSHCNYEKTWVAYDREPEEDNHA